MWSSGLVSIIMLSRNGGRFAEQSVRSVMAQTYTNWELLFYAPYSKDSLVTRMMELKDQDARIKVFQVVEQEKDLSRNMGLRDAKGRWIAFLDCGDLWDPEKLEHQIDFMETRNYHFSYTEYEKMGLFLWLRGAIFGGPKKLTREDIIRCCWPGYLTVMYDAKEVGLVHVEDLRYNNDYALWLKISEKVDCYLLPECLAKLRTPQSNIVQFLMTDKINWRYRVYRKLLGRGMFVSIMMTLRNLYYSTLKRVKYVRNNH